MIDIPAKRIVNAVSVDVEDWLQSTINPSLPLTDRFYDSTRKVLKAFSDRNVKGTFFVLGLAAEMAPDLIREIHAEGHEIQSHGHGHELVYSISRQAFRDDIERSKKHLEDLLGVEIYGYRAPAFSIVDRSIWAIDELVEAGFRYDSSIFPISMKRYGIESTPYHAFRLRTSAGNEIDELPVASWRLGPRRFPMGGGGYFRLFPYFAMRAAVSQLNQEQHPATIYLHPYEYDPVEFSEIDYPVSLKTRLHQGIGRSGFPKKIDQMLTDFTFGTMQQVIESHSGLPVHEYCLSDC